MGLNCGSVCVFCASSDVIDPAHRDLAERLGTALGQSGYDMVFGGADVGLMGAVARSAQAAGSRITAIIPQSMIDRGIAYTDAHELMAVNDLRDRKALMDARSDAFVILPGGLGTLEEALEALNLKFLRFHTKPIIFLDPEGFYAPLWSLLERYYAEGFSSRAVEQLYTRVRDCAAVIEYLRAYEAPVVDDSFYERAQG